jgi:DNA repair exonuclease SbcCD ATPase subunit
MKREPNDSDEILEHIAQYEHEAARLLETLAKRDEMVGLLKIAQPSKIAPLREYISRLDKSIEQAEAILESISKQITAGREFEAKIAELLEFTDKLRPALLKHVAEHNPEKLEQIEALFAEDYNKTH